MAVCSGGFCSASGVEKSIDVMIFQHSIELKENMCTSFQVSQFTKTCFSGLLEEDFLAASTPEKKFPRLRGLSPKNHLKLFA